MGQDVERTVLRMAWSEKPMRDDQAVDAIVSDSDAPKGAAPAAEPAARPAVRLPLAVKLGCVLVILLALSGFATQLMRYNEIRSQTERIREEITEYELKIARMRYLVGAPLDPTYIQETAREKLGLAYPDEVVYYNDLGTPEK
jgi:cell division protein FtsB